MTKLPDLAISQTKEITGREKSCRWKRQLVKAPSPSSSFADSSTLEPSGGHWRPCIGWKMLHRGEAGDPHHASGAPEHPRRSSRGHAASVVARVSTPPRRLRGTRDQASKADGRSVPAQREPVHARRL